ncbi:replication initiation protein [Methyloglobulus sp.]|uniref:replication initiation protein n=1 Tax=Methyloglobulus sp. TaxID=2518622 RepID=UPI0032B757C8
MIRLIACILVILSFAVSANSVESTCYGSVSNGKLENGIKLPVSGRNFSAYSLLGNILGRTYLHSQAVDIVLTTYQALEQSAAGKVFTYGETGWASGGRIRPHRTHRNGLSIDFMVPVINQTNKSVFIPTGVINKFGYGLEFDENAKYKNYKIDFEAIAEHLYQLDIVAKAKGSSIALVIFDLSYLPKLFASKHGEYLNTKVNFMKGNPWIRHDEHYHVDFSIPCKPMKDK